MEGILGGIALAGVGVASAILEWRTILEAARSRRWPRVQGRVISAEFQKAPASGVFMRPAKGRAAISYRFELNGLERSGNRVFVGDDRFGSAYEAQKRTRHYYPGVSVDVYYDPQDPSRTVLETGPRAWDLSMLLLSILLLCVGVSVVIWP